MTVGQFCSLCWISNKKFYYKIVTKNYNTNLYHHLHHKNVIKQTNTLHFIPKNSGKNGIAHHYTIIHKCNTKIVTHFYNTKNHGRNKTIWMHNRRQDHILPDHTNHIPKHNIKSYQYNTIYPHNNVKQSYINPQ